MKAGGTRTQRFVGALTLAAAMAGSSSVAAQQSPDLAAEIRELRLAVERLAATFEQDRELRRVDLLLKRAEVEALGLAPWETRALRARDQVSDLEQQQVMFEAQLEDVDQRLFEAETDEQEEQLRQERDALRRAVETYQEQLRLARDEAAEIENEANRRRILLDDLKDRVDRALGLLP